jgi:dihydrofolate reductase
MNSSTKLRVSVFIATSLDGFIARPDGDIDWLHEVEDIGGGDDAGYAAFFDTIDVLVMGRGSFEKVLEFDGWPYPKPVIVLSKSLKDVPDNLRDKVKIDASAPQELLEKLSQDGIKRIYLDGGKVIQSFLREGLVDDMIITTIPILIGKGIPLFGDLEKDIKLRHVETKTWHNGFVQSKYEVLK